MNIEQRTTLPFLAQEEYLELLIEGFLTSRKAKNVTAGTMKFYKGKLAIFNKFCQSQHLNQITQDRSKYHQRVLAFLERTGKQRWRYPCSLSSSKNFLEVV
jgi:site-specific recombinase XerD